MRALLLSMILGLGLMAQETINGGRTILGPVDATAATTVKPFKQGLSANIPATCAVGETYFKTDATAGSNLFGCTSTNTWTLLGGGGADHGVLIAGACSAVITTAASGTSYFIWGPCSSGGADAGNRHTISPITVDLTAFCIEMITAQPADGALNFYIAVNGVAAGTLTINIPASTTAGRYCGSGTTSVTAGNSVGVKVINSSASVSGQYQAGAIGW